MGRVLTNAVTLQMARESSANTQPTSGWNLLEPTTIGKFGPNISKLHRSPISKNRQRRKGSVTDLDSNVEFEQDLTYSFLKLALEPLMFATLLGATVYYPSAVTSTGFTVAASGDVADGTLFHVKGCKNAENNGIHVAAGTSTTIEIKCSGLVAETGLTSRGVTLEICGVQGATGDFQINSAGDLISTTFDWTTGIGAMVQEGQFIWVGYDSGGAHSFANTANRGLRRVVSKSAGRLFLDRESAAFATDNGASKDIWVLFGQYIRNWPVGDSNYLEPQTWFELAYENLGDTPGTDKYEYAESNYFNEATIALSTTSKATISCSFLGRDCQPPTTSRATGASSALPPVATTMYNTSVDFLRLRVMDYSEVVSTTFFKTVNFKIGNNVAGEKVLAKLGPQFMNAGEFDLDIDSNIILTSGALNEAIRANTTMTMECAIRNDDGAFVFDVPAMTIEGGEKEFPVGQSVGITMKAMGFQDPRFGYTFGVSCFPHLPAS